MQAWPHHSLASVPPSLPRATHEGLCIVQAHLQPLPSSHSHVYSSIHNAHTVPSVFPEPGTAFHMCSVNVCTTKENTLVQDQDSCCLQEMCNLIGPLDQSVPFVPESCRQPTSLKKGLFPILIRVWYCWAPMTTFTTGFRLLPMSWRASNTFTRTYQRENRAPVLGSWTPRLPQGLFFKIAKCVKNHLLQVEREPQGEACRSWIC